MFSKLQTHFHYTVATIVAIIAAAITVATTLGLHVNANARDAILQLAGLVLGGVVIGGGIKTSGMLQAGVHPLVREQLRADAAERAETRHAYELASALGTELPMTVADAAEAVGMTLSTGDGKPVRGRPLGQSHRGAHPLLKAYGTFAGLPLGKLDAVHDARTPLLAEFMTDAAVLGRKLPRKTDRLAHVEALMGSDFGMMGNDTYGDCTCAALGHAIQMWTGAHEAPVSLTTAEVMALYWATGSQDDGRVMFEVLKYAQHNGIAGHQLGAYVGVGLRRYRHRDVRAAIDLFGGCYLGVALPETAQTQHIWDVTGDPSKPGPAEAGSWGGHAIWLPDYDSDGPTCITWAHELKMTWRFLDAYADEGYAIIAPDWLAGGKTIEGIDLAGLTDYLNRIKSGYQPS